MSIREISSSRYRKIRFAKYRVRNIEISDARKMITRIITSFRHECRPFNICVSTFIHYTCDVSGPRAKSRKSFYCLRVQFWKSNCLEIMTEISTFQNLMTKISSRKCENDKSKHSKIYWRKWAVENRKVTGMSTRKYENDKSKHSKMQKWQI